MHLNWLTFLVVGCAMLVSNGSFSQSIQRSSINSWGASVQKGNVVLSQTAGQSSTTQVFHNGNYLRQGFQQSSGLKLKTTEWEIALFPNPNSGSFQFSVISGGEDIRFKITDAQGKQVHAETTMEKPQQTVTINGLSEGMYFLVVSTEEGSQKMKKFIVY